MMSIGCDDWRLHIMSRVESMRQVENMFCDVTICTKDGTDLHANRIILAAGSSVLYSMMKESVSNKGQVVGVRLVTDYTTLSWCSVLHFLYTGEKQDAALSPECLCLFQTLAIPVAQGHPRSPHSVCDSVGNVDCNSRQNVAPMKNKMSPDKQIKSSATNGEDSYGKTTGPDKSLSACDKPRQESKCSSQVSMCGSQVGSIGQCLCDSAHDGNATKAGILHAKFHNDVILLSNEVSTYGNVKTECTHCSDNFATIKETSETCAAAKSTDNVNSNETNINLSTKDSSTCEQCQAQHKFILETDHMTSRDNLVYHVTKLKSRDIKERCSVSVCSTLFSGHIGSRLNLPTSNAQTWDNESQFVNETRKFDTCETIANRNASNVITINGAASAIGKELYCLSNSKEKSSQHYNETAKSTAPICAPATATTNHITGKRVRLSRDQLKELLKSSKKVVILKPPIATKFEQKTLNTDTEKRNSPDVVSDTLEKVTQESVAHEITTRDCRLCTGLVLPNQQALDKHLNLHIEKSSLVSSTVEKSNRKTVSLPDSVGKCPECPKHFKTESRLRLHWRFAHARAPKYTCSVCGRPFRFAVLIKRHRNRCRGGKSYKCNTCAQRFRSRSRMWLHRRTHINVVRTRKQPKKTSKTHDARSHSNECKSCTCKLDTCSECSTSTKHVRGRKMAAQSNGKAGYACQECNRVFSHRRNLAAHIRYNHQQARKFHCDVCDKSFYRRDIFENHLSSNLHMKIVHMRGEEALIERKFAALRQAIALKKKQSSIIGVVDNVNKEGKKKQMDSVSLEKGVSKKRNKKQRKCITDCIYLRSGVSNDRNKKQRNCVSAVDCFSVKSGKEHMNDTYKRGNMKSENTQTDFIDTEGHVNKQDESREMDSIDTVCGVNKSSKKKLQRKKHKQSIAEIVDAVLNEGGKRFQGNDDKQLMNGAYSVDNVVNKDNKKEQDHKQSFKAVMHQNLSKFGPSKVEGWTIHCDFSSQAEIKISFKTEPLLPMHKPNVEQAIANTSSEKEDGITEPANSWRSEHATQQCTLNKIAVREHCDNRDKTGVCLSDNLNHNISNQQSLEVECVSTSHQGTNGCLSTIPVGNEPFGPIVNGGIKSKSAPDNSLIEPEIISCSANENEYGQVQMGDNMMQSSNFGMESVTLENKTLNDTQKSPGDKYTSRENLYNDAPNLVSSPICFTTKETPVDSRSIVASSHFSNEFLNPIDSNAEFHTLPSHTILETTESQTLQNANISVQHQTIQQQRQNKSVLPFACTGMNKILNTIMLPESSVSTSQLASNPLPPRTDEGTGIYHQSHISQLSSVPVQNIPGTQLLVLPSVSNTVLLPQNFLLFSQLPVGVCPPQNQPSTIDLVKKSRKSPRKFEKRKGKQKVTEYPPLAPKTPPNTHKSAPAGSTFRVDLSDWSVFSAMMKTPELSGTPLLNKMANVNKDKESNPGLHRKRSKPVIKSNCKITRLSSRKIMTSSPKSQATCGILEHASASPEMKPLGSLQDACSHLPGIKKLPVSPQAESQPYFPYARQSLMFETPKKYGELTARVDLNSSSLLAISPIQNTSLTLNNDSSVYQSKIKDGQLARIGPSVTSAPDKQLSTLTVVSSSCTSTQEFVPTEPSPSQYSFSRAITFSSPNDKTVSSRNDYMNTFSPSQLFNTSVQESLNISVMSDFMSECADVSSNKAVKTPCASETQAFPNVFETPIRNKATDLSVLPEAFESPPAQITRKRKRLSSGGIVDLVLSPNDSFPGSQKIVFATPSPDQNHAISHRTNRSGTRGGVQMGAELNTPTLSK